LVYKNKTLIWHDIKITFVGMKFKQKLGIFYNGFFLSITKMDFIENTH